MAVHAFDITTVNYLFSYNGFEFPAAFGVFRETADSLYIQSLSGGPRIITNITPGNTTVASVSYATLSELQVALAALVYSTADPGGTPALSLGSVPPATALLTSDFTDAFSIPSFFSGYLGFLFKDSAGATKTAFDVEDTGFLSVTAGLVYFTPGLDFPATVFTALKDIRMRIHFSMQILMYDGTHKNILQVNKALWNPTQNAYEIVETSTADRRHIEVEDNVTVNHAYSGVLVDLSAGDSFYLHDTVENLTSNTSDFDVTYTPPNDPISGVGESPAMMVSMDLWDRTGVSPSRFMRPTQFPDIDKLLTPKKRKTGKTGKN